MKGFVTLLVYVLSFGDSWSLLGGEFLSLFWIAVCLLYFVFFLLLYYFALWVSLSVFLACYYLLLNCSGFLFCRFWLSFFYCFGCFVVQCCYWLLIVYFDYVGYYFVCLIVYWFLCFLLVHYLFHHRPN